MINLKLEISGVPLDINGDIGVAITYQLQDIKDVGSRSQAFTYTIKLPASQRVNEIFYSLYDLSVAPDNELLFRNQIALIPQADSIPFNRNKYTPARLIQNGVVIFDGWLILDRIVTSQGQIHTYEITLIGDRAKWVEAAKNIYLKDISYYNILLCFDLTFILDALSYGSGALYKSALYCLPLVDYGNLAGNLAPGVNDIDIEDLYPGYFVKALVYHGFNELGYDVIENIFDNGLERLIMPFSNPQWLTTLGAPGGLIAAADRVWQLRNIPRDYNLDQSVVDALNADIIDFDTVISDEFNTLKTFLDGSIVEGPAIGELYTNLFSPPNSVSCSGGDISIRYVFSVTVKIFFLKPYGPSAGALTVGLKTGGAAFPFYTDTLTFAGQGYYEQTFSFDGNILLTPGNTVYPFINIKTETYAGWKEFEIYNSYQEIYLDTTLRENYQFNLKDNLPNVTFLDLMRGLIAMFNLIVTTDENERVVTISQRDEFYQPAEQALYAPPSSGAQEISYYDFGARVDYAQNIEQKFSNRDLPRLTNFTYEDGSDYLIENFNDNNAAPYASYVVESNCEVVTDEKDVSAAPFAATLTGALLHDLSWLIVARLTDSDIVPAENVTDWEPRILIYDEPQTPPGASWNLRYNNFSSVYNVTFFRHAYMKGKFGNLEFSSLYANYYSAEFELLFASRLVNLSVFLTEADLANLDFSKPVRVGNFWFYLSKIDKYKPDEKSTKVELIQIV